MQHATRNTQHVSRSWSLVILAAILLLASYFRFTGLNWDEGQWIHPDEGHMRMTLSSIRMPDTLSLYFDTHNSPLNVRNTGGRYSYGTLPLFTTRAITEWLDRGCGESAGNLSVAAAALLLGPLDEPCRPGTFTGAYSALVGRALSALADLGTVLLIYLIGRRLYGETVGLLAAGLGALTAFSIQQAHFFTVDSMACFFVTLTVYFSVRASQTGNWLDFGGAGLATGLAAACKVSAAFASLLVVLAAIRYALRRARFTHHVLRIAPHLLLAGLLAIVAFRVAQPYAFEGPGFFGLRPSPEWFGRLAEIRVEQSGKLDYPWGRQWTDRAPILFPWTNMVVWGMGLPLGLAAWAGWAVAGFELWRKKWDHLIPWGWASLMFVYQATGWVKAMRYFLSLYPIFTVFAAYLLVRSIRSSRCARKFRRVAFVICHLTFVICVTGAALWAIAVFSIYLRPHTRLAASRWIYENVPQGATIANEHYDWGVPLRIDGHDPFGGMYDGLEMRPYDEDTPQKRAQLYDWLDEADYIALSSNRLYASIPRLPARYPLTIEYYRALFAGELGFELAADFTSRPALGPFQFPDQETPFPLMEPRDYVYQTEPIEVRLPPAEEAFSVYDHPRVLIFRKTAGYSRPRVEQVLGKIDLERALHGLKPVDIVGAPDDLVERVQGVYEAAGEIGLERALEIIEKAPDLLEFDPQTWAKQQAGGTWSEMFDRNSLLNRYPALAALAWWVVVTVLGWLAFPLLFAALPRLRDRGYGLARVLALLLIAYLTWLAASLRVLPNTRGTILRMVLLLALVGGGVGWFERDELRRFLRSRWRLLSLIEGLFALLYLAWIGVRLLHPDLWHPVVGGEKPMDFAYLNAVIKSTWFPPYNPWFSGSWINYYYFGFVIVGTLTKLVGTLPAIAYNLAIPLLFALTGVGAFSVAYNLFSSSTHSSSTSFTPILAGLAALAFTILLGNLGVVHLIRNSLVKLGGEPFHSTIPGFAENVAMFRGLWDVIVHDVKLPLRIESWYWHPTRIIPAETGNPIAEFPAFTFLYADLHAHMIAFPLTLLALALAVYWVRDPRPRWPSLALGGLVIGALWPTNTWDYPTYLGLGLAALALGVWGRRGGEAGYASRSVIPFVWRAALLVGLTVLLYLPYHQHYAAGYSSFERWRGLHTPLDIYLWIHGILLFPLATHLFLNLKSQISNLKSRFALLMGLIGLFILALALYFLGYEIALVTIPVGTLAALLVIREVRNQKLGWLMVGASMALGLAVEIVVLKGDIGRQNTVFKFYLQAWIMLSVAAAVSLAWVRERARRWRPEWRQLWWIGMAALIFGGALFLPYGIRARAVDRIAPETGLTLDGMAFVEHATVFDGPDQDIKEIPLAGDYAAMRWIQDHIQGSPVILEGLGRREYLWANRVSIYTGLPTVAGWRWHQVQQRAVLPAQMVERRRADVAECYSTTDVARAQEILSRYTVRYVYVGAYEWAYYNPAGLVKFDTMAAEGLLRVVYDARGVRIYEVISD